MITILTGPPGSGKSLALVTRIAAEYEGRPIFYCHIDDLQLPWLRIDNPRDWQSFLPTDGVLIVDEAQKFWPKRPINATVPPDIMALAEHRHAGVDIVLACPNPGMMDKFVLECVGRFQFFHRALGLQAATIFTWDGFEEAYKSPSRQAMAVVERWNFPKAGYKLYKSAEAHTHKVRIPKFMWLGLAGVVFLGLLIWLIITMLTTVGKGAEFAAEKKSALATAFEIPRPDGGKSSTVDPLDPMGIHAAERRQIETAGKPWMADRFAKLIEAKRAPVPVACIMRAGERAGCVCYTDEATIIANVDQGFCMDFVAGKVYPEWKGSGGRGGGNPFDVGTEKLPAFNPVAALVSPLLPKPKAEVEAPPISIPPGAPVTGWRSSDWSIHPRYQ